MQESILTLEVQGSAMDLFIFRPAGEGPFPAILLAQHIPVGHAGLERDEFTLNTARRLAASGCIIAVPFLFHWWPKEAPLEQKRAESRDDRILADMQAAWAQLKRMPEVDASRLALVGHCWGGRVAWLSACHMPDCRALAVFYGGNIHRGLGAGNPAPLSLAARIPCAVIGFFGNEDSNPSPEDVESYSEALGQAGVSHEFHQYDEAGHAFQNFPAPERYHAQASEDAWEKLLAFLTEQLALDQVDGCC